MKALFELFRRFDARRIFGFIRRLGGMSRPKVKCYDLRSTHALRVEGDRHKIGRDMIQDLFLSTPSGWRATCRSTGTAVRTCHFYPRPPGGGRRFTSQSVKSYADFYPRPPGGGRPCHVGRLSRLHGISIHALRVEGDRAGTFTASISRYFYPRPPGGGRRPALPALSTPAPISIHALRVEGDASVPHSHTPFGLFLSTPSGWRATFACFGRASV